MWFFDSKRRAAGLLALTSALSVGLLQTACNKDPVPVADTPDVQKWTPDLIPTTPRETNTRGFLDRRGLIHAHSYYSHDACDGNPVDENGNPNEQCYQDFREGLCKTKHDFVFLTDHPDLFENIEFPDTLLYRADEGDVLVEHSGEPTASWLHCDGQDPALIMAGDEGATMPVGLNHHAAPAGDRGSVYGSRTPEAFQALKDAGAVVLVSHTENFSADDLVELPIDGFEMFNLHANMYLDIPSILDLAIRVADGETASMPHPDLSVLRILSEDPAYLDTWGTTLSRGVRRVTTMGTDCHRNTFPGLLGDGERIDSYRRMMRWFSNHLLVSPNAEGKWSDIELKEALAAGRLYGTFDLMGYPVGFDYFAKAEGPISEMGDEVTLSAGLKLTVKRPSVQDLPASAEQPEITVRLLRAREGGWDEVATTNDGDLIYDVTQPGAYRAEVRMIPYHLREFLGDDDLYVLRNSRPWVYSNPIYVR